MLYVKKTFQVTLALMADPVCLPGAGQFYSHETEETLFSRDGGNSRKVMLHMDRLAARRQSIGPIAYGIQQEGKRVQQ